MSRKFAPNKVLHDNGRMYISYSVAKAHSDALLHELSRKNSEIDHLKSLQRDLFTRSSSLCQGEAESRSKQKEIKMLNNSFTSIGSPLESQKSPEKLINIQIELISKLQEMLAITMCELTDAERKISRLVSKTCHYQEDIALLRIRYALQYDNLNSRFKKAQEIIHSLKFK